ncbi:MAG: ATP-binding protein [Proteobacteria bacterium]|nr:ATP-binding protein [Pseudomonadota bacterium]
MNIKSTNIFKHKLYLYSFLISLLLFLFFYLIISKVYFLNDYIFIFSLFLFIICLFFSYLFFLFLKYFLSFWKERQLKRAGNELRNKLIFIFSAIALIPTLIISIFSVLIFNTALNSWFNPIISSAVLQSEKVANQYLLEHQNAMRGDVLEFANILNINALNLSSNKNKFSKFIDNYTRKNNLSEAVLIDSNGNVLAFSDFVFEYTYADILEKDYLSANNGKIIIKKEDNSNKMQAFMKLSQYVDAYLLISRFVDKRVLDAIQNTALAVSDYQSIELEQFNLEISFVVIFLFLTLILLLGSLIIGLKLANKLVNPISSLIKAAEEVGSGNLDYKITKKELLNFNVNEIQHLGQSFNKMIYDLKNSRIDIVNANNQLDKRRQFSETVLSGVYSGVIGLDENLQLNLPNLTACKILDISIEKDFGKLITKIVPEFSNLIDRILKSNILVLEERVQIIKEDKILNLMTRIVVQKKQNKILGYVLTFDDITNLIAAQKMAAWSDIARRIAHEIKNPLTPISLAAERLKKHIDKPIMLNKKIFEQSLNMITRQVDDIRYLVDEFSSFARMPSPILNQVNIIFVVRQYVEPLKMSFEKITIKLDKIKYKDILIMADEKQIRQAIGNIIKNSYENIITNNIKNGVVSIDFEKDNDFVSITFKDNGTGINTNDISKIVEPYFSTKMGGSGLGLAITKKIIEDHNGSIKIKSPKDEKGTIIIIKFPIVLKYI